MKYRVILASRAEEMLLAHIHFLAQVSIPAAKILKNEFASVVQRLENNPLQFQLEEDLNLPKGKYRRAIFCRRYKAVFFISEETVYVDAIIDCRTNWISV